MAVTVALRASLAATDTKFIAAGGFTRANRRPSVVISIAPARPTSQHTAPAGDDPAVSARCLERQRRRGEGCRSARRELDGRPGTSPSAGAISGHDDRSAARRLPRAGSLAKDAGSRTRRLLPGAAGGAAAEERALAWRPHCGFGLPRIGAGCCAARPAASLAARSAAVGAAGGPLPPHCDLQASGHRCRRRGAAPVRRPAAARRCQGRSSPAPGTSAPWECARIPPPRAAAGSFPRRALGCSRALAPRRTLRLRHPHDDCERCSRGGGHEPRAAPPRPPARPGRGFFVGAGLMRASVATSAWHSAHAARCASIDCAAPASRRRSIHAAAASASRWDSPAAAAAVVRNARFSSRAMTSSRRR